MLDSQRPNAAQVRAKISRSVRGEFVRGKFNGERIGPFGYMTSRATVVDNSPEYDSGAVCVPIHHTVMDRGNTSASHGGARSLPVALITAETLPGSSDRGVPPLRVGGTWSQDTSTWVARVAAYDRTRALRRSLEDARASNRHLGNCTRE